MSERQKKFVKYAEQFGKVQEISSNLQKCQAGLKDVIKDMEVLNNMLPPEERLEPFVMVTGQDEDSECYDAFTTLFATDE